MRLAVGEEELAKRYRRVGEWLKAVDMGRGAEGVEGLEITEVRLRLATEEDPMVLLVVKGRVGLVKYIAFVGARAPNEALLAWRKRSAGGGLKWREERAWGEQA